MFEDTKTTTVKLHRKIRCTSIVKGCFDLFEHGRQVLVHKSHRVSGWSPFLYNPRNVLYYLLLVCKKTCSSGVTIRVLNPTKTFRTSIPDLLSRKSRGTEAIKV